MSKAVVYTLLAAAFILLILFSHTTKPNHKSHHGPHGLSRRLAFKITPPIFDPLVQKMERLAEEKGLNNHESPINLEPNPFFGELEDSSKYVNIDGKLNITLRLMVLFPVLDRAPKDGLIDSKELEAWIVHQAIDGLDYRTRRELESRDKDGDGAISFSEYLPLFSNEDIERNEIGHGEAGWWKEQFRNADADGNGTLSFYEFRDFLHPEDSKNKQIQKWLLREKIRQMDYDKDQKLNFLEFKNGAYDTYKNYFEFETGGSDTASPEHVFAKLDVNKDKLLEVEELKPLIQYLSPGELSYAKSYTRYLIHEADDDGDGKLTVDEMLQHEYIFYNTIYDDSRYGDDGEDLHDEL